MRAAFLRPVAWLLAGAFAAPAGAASQAFQGDYPQAYFRPPEPTFLRSFKMQQMLQDQEPAQELAALSAVACAGGDAGGYPCSNIDLESFVPIADLVSGDRSNDIWGWTDPLTDREYAIIGMSDGTTFVDVTEPRDPIVLGHLATHTSSSTWRDIKVYQDHAFIVSEANDHGMQVFDLTRLRAVTAPPVNFVETAHYADFGDAHNLVLNEDSGFAYGVGTSTCSGGLHAVDVRIPTAPVFAGCFDADGYTHDAQCITYCGPDGAYLDREICFNYNEDTVTIVDVTDKSAPIQISRTTYPNAGYTHQGWITDDQRHILFDDELDERNVGFNTSTHIWDVSDLDAPSPIGIFDSSTPAIDHNQYIVGNRVFQSNYRAGLRILDISCIDSASVTEIGFFDVYPANDNPSFNGTWSNYPFFPSGVVVVSGIEQGLFVLRPRVTTVAEEIAIDPDAPTICRGQSVDLAVGGTWAAADWATAPAGESGDGASGASITVAPAVTTKYRVETDDGSGCGSFAGTVVTVVEPPSITARASKSAICVGESVDLAAPWRDWTSLEWTTDPAAQPGDGVTAEELTVSPTVTTRYTVAVTDGGGCDASDELTIDVHPAPAPVVVPAEVSLCLGDSVELRVGSFAAVTWRTDPPGQPGDGELSDSISVAPTVDTRYRVEVLTGDGCAGAAAAEVLVAADPAPPALGNVLLLTRTVGGDALTHHWRDLTGSWGDYQLLSLGFADGPASAARLVAAGQLAASAAPGLERLVDGDGQVVPAGDVYYRIRATSPCGASAGPL